MSHYDFLFAKAKLANSMEAVCPKVNMENRIKIIEGRHPFIGSDAVPLDFTIGGDYRALVITGPNTGGKTVVLKTVGLFCLMAQSGLHVPADNGTELAVFGDILADIGDGQSIEQSLSTFSAHIRNIISIVKCVDSRSLVILDELGTGTDPAEGMGLAVAVMEKLYEKGCIMLCTTHYSEIKEFAHVTPGFKNGCMLFDTDTLLPLYRLSIGIPGESNAFLISLRLGMDPSIIERAHMVTYKEEHHYELKMQQKQNDVFVNENILLTHDENKAKSVQRTEAKKAAEKLKVDSPYKIGDCVFITSMNRTGIVCDLENPRGEIGIMVLKKRFIINKKRLRPFIDGKDLYPEDYDLDIVLESKEYRRNKKTMSKRHVEGLTLEH
jgi:dsDNA-specific endonuclease/ATPase MutS2